MTTKRKLSKRACRLIKNFDAAATALAWHGNGEPEEDAKLIPRFKQAKSKLCEYVSRLENLLAELKVDYQK